MEEEQVGWIAAIIIGGIAGWLAEKFMKSQMGLLRRCRSSLVFRFASIPDCLCQPADPIWIDEGLRADSARSAAHLRAARVERRAATQPG